MYLSRQRRHHNEQPSHKDHGTAAQQHDFAEQVGLHEIAASHAEYLRLELGLPPRLVGKARPFDPDRQNSGCIGRRYSGTLGAVGDAGGLVLSATGLRLCGWT